MASSIPTENKFFKQINLLHRHYHSVDLGVMEMKGYGTLLRSPKLEPHHQMLYSHIQDTPF